MASRDNQMSPMSVVFLMLCTATITLMVFYNSEYSEAGPIMISDSSSSKAEDTAVKSWNSNAANSIVTSLTLTKNDKRKGGLNIQEHEGNLKHCLKSSDIPKTKIEPRKNKTTLDDVNAEIFGGLVHRAKHIADVANKALPTIRKRRKSSEEAAGYIDQTIAEMNLAVDVDDYRLLPGGHWIPLSCRPLWKVAIIVGFRNRFEHLPIFLRHIVPLLKRQKLEFSIFISEQRNDLIFNKAMLMNIGFIEALSFSEFDCVVFHDVDHLAMNVGNYYGCESMPRHLESGELRWHWSLPYQELVGGAAGVTISQFIAINGYPNVYWGWGGEDDDFYYRVVAKGFKLSRPEGEIGYFDTIPHDNKDSSRLNSAKFCLTRLCTERMDTDGLSNLAYEAPTIELHPLYTNISVNIQRLPWNPNWKSCEMMTDIVIGIVMIVATMLILMIVMLFIRFRTKKLVSITPYMHEWIYKERCGERE